MKSRLTALLQSLRKIRPADIVRRLRMPTSQTDEYGFKRSLARNVVLGLLALALLPVILMGTVTYLRSRVLLSDQTSSQMQSTISSQARQFEQIGLLNQRFLDGLVADPRLEVAMVDIVSDPNELSYTALANIALSIYKNDAGKSGAMEYSEIVLLRPDGSILATTIEDWRNTPLNETYPFKNLIGQTKDLVTINPLPFYPGKLVIFSSRYYKNETLNLEYTAVVSAFSEIPVNALDAASSLFTNGQAFLITDNNKIAGINLARNALIEFVSDTTQMTEVNKLFQTSAEGGLGSYATRYQLPVLGYARYMPGVSAGIALEVPEADIYNQVNSLFTFNLLMIALVALVIGIVVYSAAGSLLTPLNGLVQSAQRFSTGDFATRATVDRTDELGLLSFTFNRMVEQISDLYRSLEAKVEARTQQLITAAEVGQVATSASSRDEILQRTVGLITERFNYPAAAAYTVDVSGTSAILQAVTPADRMPVARGFRVPLGTDSLVGFTAASNQAHAINDLRLETGYGENPLQLEETRSVVAIPVSAGSTVLGVLEIQSTQENSFEKDDIAAFMALANQVATGLQNVRLLESAQVNLEETALLYRASRQVTQARTEQELLEFLTKTLAQTPYVSGVFGIEDAFISIQAITDPRNPSATNTSQGITLPLKQIATRLQQSPMVLIEDTNEPSDFDNLLSFFIRRGCRSAALFSVLEDGKLTRVIVLGSRESAPVTAAAMQPFANLAEVVSTTLNRLHLLTTLGQKLNELETLSKFSQIISVENDPAKLYQSLHTQVVDTVGSDVSFIVALYSAQTNQIDFPYMYEKNEQVKIDPVQLGEGLTSYIIRTQKPLLINKDLGHVAAEMGISLVGRIPMSWMGIPLVAGGESVGALIVRDTEKEERFDDALFSLFNTLAPQLATTIRNAQLLDEMQGALKAYDQERFLLNTWLGNTPDYIAFKDADGRFTRVSESYAHSVGKTGQSIIGLSDYDVFDQKTAAQHFQYDQGVILSGQNKIGDAVLEEQDGQEIWRLRSSILMREQTGQVNGIMSINRNITDMKKTEQLAQKRANQLRTASEIARDTAGTLNVEELLEHSVNLVRERFGFYHSSIFLVDPLNEFAVLRASTGEVGARMLITGHKLAVGSKSIIGQTTSLGEVKVVNDVNKDPNYFANPNLPDTRSEAAFPLRVGTRVLGALDAQSRLVDAFLEEDISILQILADQLATAVLNANLFARTQENLGQHRLLHQITVASASAASLDEALAVTVSALRTSRGGGRVAVLLTNAEGDLELKASAGYEGEMPFQTAVKPGEGIIGQAALERRPIRVDDTLTNPQYIAFSQEVRSELAVPILYSDNLLGVLNLESSEPAAYDETDQEILASLGNNLGAVIANAQLVRTVRTQVERQNILFEATNKIRRSSEIQAILETSAAEICQALGARRAHIEITAGQAEPQPVPAAEHGSNGFKNNGKEVVK